MISAGLSESAGSRPCNNMQSTCALSIIIANYNNAPYLGNCLDSILQQTFKDVEVIVADDCSSDNSAAIIRGYAARYPDIFKTFFSPVNRGVAITRHDAILKAQGAYLTTLDSDDYYCDVRKLEIEMQLVRQCREIERQDILAFSHVVIVDGDGRRDCARRETSPVREGFIFNDLITRSCMIPRDFVMKRQTYFEAGGYDFSLVTHEDWDLKIRLSRICPFRCTGISGTAYRRNPAGLSRLPFAQRADNLWRVFRKNLRLAPHEVQPALKKKFLLFMGQQCSAHMRMLFAVQKARCLAEAFTVLSIHIKWRARLSFM
jgi:glycosyltransferase involved in cell wall biosynthesis